MQDNHAKRHLASILVTTLCIGVIIASWPLTVRLLSPEARLPLTFPFGQLGLALACAAMSASLLMDIPLIRKEWRNAKYSAQFGTPAARQDGMVFGVLAALYIVLFGMNIAMPSVLNIPMSPRADRPETMLVRKPVPAAEPGEVLWAPNHWTPPLPQSPDPGRSRDAN